MPSASWRGCFERQATRPRKPSGRPGPTNWRSALVAAFWREDHFGEYIHPERGLVDCHGLSDVNWAAVAFGVAAGRNLELLWPRLIKEPGFWLGDMPTQSVSKPFRYEKWEYPEPLPFPVAPLNDVAAMGRVWHLEAIACRRMKERSRLVESTRKVLSRGLEGRRLLAQALSSAGQWRGVRRRRSKSTANTRQSWCGWSSAIEKSSFADSFESWRNVRCEKTM